MFQLSQHELINTVYLYNLRYMFGLKDQAIVSSMGKLMYSGVQFNLLIDKNY
jgi:hypothetical protein